jgi:hypothetical protein
MFTAPNSAPQSPGTASQSKAAQGFQAIIEQEKTTEPSIVAGLILPSR